MKMGRPQEWLDIPSWDDYQIHPDKRVRRGAYVLTQFTDSGISRVRLYKQLRLCGQRTHKQLFSVPVYMLMRWAGIEGRCLVCGDKHDTKRHYALLDIIVRSRPAGTPWGQNPFKES
jgi:hypothetical protein